MIFSNLDIRTKKLLLLFLSCLFCWWLLVASGTCSASEIPAPAEQKVAVYQITEPELVRLENNLVLLKASNERLQVDLKVQSDEATQLKKELAVLKKELSDLRQKSKTQGDSLTNANRLLEQYATEAKRERLRIKAQRNTWEAVAACLVVALVAK